MLRDEPLRRIERDNWENPIQERNEQVMTQLEEYQMLVEILKIYHEDMSIEEQEKFKDEYIQLDWNMRLLHKALYDNTTKDFEDVLEDYLEDKDNVVSFYTKEEQKLAAQTAKELYNTDILVCEMDAPELCCDEL